jgi:hypothetical protein
MGALTYAMFNLSKCTEFLNNLPVDLSRNVTKCDDLISATTYSPEYLGFNFLPVLLGLSTCTHNTETTDKEARTFSNK